MGTWGIGSFENDGGLDWLDDFLESPSTRFLESTFNPIPPAKHQDQNKGLFARIFSFSSKTPEYHQQFDPEAALAAAETMAILSGFPGEPPCKPEVFAGLDEIAFDPKLRKCAAEAVKKILADSDLAESWKETDDFDRWVTIIDDLIHRLTA